MKLKSMQGISLLVSSHRFLAAVLPTFEVQVEWPAI